MTVHQTQCSACYKLDKENAQIVPDVGTPLDSIGAYKALERQLTILHKFQDRILSGFAGKDEKELSRLISDTSRAVAQVSKELLAYEKAEMDSIEDMGTEEWTEAICDWFAKLSHTKREALVDKLHAIHWDAKGRLKSINAKKTGTLSEDFPEDIPH